MSKRAECLAGCDLAGYNIAGFDLPLLEAEFRRAGVESSLEGRRIVDVMRIFHDRVPRTLGGAVRFYCGREIEDAHSTEADTLSSFEVLDASSSGTLISRRTSTSSIASRAPLGRSIATGGSPGGATSCVSTSGSTREGR